MEHAIDRSITGHEDDLSLSVTALIVVLAALVAFYFVLRVAVPDLPLHVHEALADLPRASEQAHFLHDEPITPSAISGVQR
jgi:hypothetical protein